MNRVVVMATIRDLKHFNKTFATNLRRRGRAGQGHQTRHEDQEEDDAPLHAHGRGRRGDFALRPFSSLTPWPLPWNRHTSRSLLMSSVVHTSPLLSYLSVLIGESSRCRDQCRRSLLARVKARRSFGENSLPLSRSFSRDDREMRGRRSSLGTSFPRIFFSFSFLFFPSRSKIAVLNKCRLEFRKRTSGVCLLMLWGKN